jgi:hypothetical protein
MQGGDVCCCFVSASATLLARLCITHRLLCLPLLLLLLPLLLQMLPPVTAVMAWLLLNEPLGLTGAAAAAAAIAAGAAAAAAAAADAAASDSCHGVATAQRATRPHWRCRLPSQRHWRDNPCASTIFVWRPQQLESKAAVGHDEWRNFYAVCYGDDVRCPQVWIGEGLRKGVSQVEQSFVLC